jgi:hypothetical protein
MTPWQRRYLRIDREVRRYFAQRKLARMVEERRNSFDVVNYRRHREAALKGRYPDGSGFRASHRASYAVSPVPASIPNAWGGL